MSHDSIEGFLLLEDGTLFPGSLIGYEKPGVAEVVFTTNMTGYQEVFSDPSYRGQIVVMTAPMIGNYGVNQEDLESPKAQVSGIVVREFSRTWSNWRATGSLADWLAETKVPVLTEVDTRQLAMHLRSAGVMRGVIGAGKTPDAETLAALGSCPPMAGMNLASVVSTNEPYAWGNAQHPYHVVAIDYGVKRNILRLFDAHGVRITVVPSSYSVQQILELKPDGVFLSNGPGDPEAVTDAPPVIKELAELEIPIFGICLGHQLLGITFGGHTVKLPYGHRGGNQPVKDLESGTVLITSQNHGFTVAGDEKGIAGSEQLVVTHINLNDGTIEGLRHRSLPVFGVQYHPEAAPGPHDAIPHFSRFLDALTLRRG